MSIKSYVYLILLPLVFAEKKNLPSYIKPCHKYDPHVKDCIVKHAKEALPYILNGDKEYNVPKLVPLKIKRVDFDTGANLKFTLSDIVIDGLDTAELKHGQYENDLINMEMTFKNIKLHAIYEIDGRVLVLPIKGTGSIELNLDDVVVTGEFPVELVERDGDKYMYFQSNHINIEEAKGNIKLDNLFNGDKRLGDQMNKFLNENWADVRKEVLPTIIKVVEKITLNVCNGITQFVPLDIAFPD